MRKIRMTTRDDLRLRRGRTFCRGLASRIWMRQQRIATGAFLMRQLQLSREHLLVTQHERSS